MKILFLNGKGDSVYHGYDVYTHRLIAYLKGQGHTVDAQFIEELQLESTHKEQAAPYEVMPHNLTDVLDSDADRIVMNLPFWSLPPDELFNSHKYMKRLRFVMHDILWWCAQHGADLHSQPCTKYEHTPSRTCQACAAYRGTFADKANEVRVDQWFKLLCSYPYQSLVVPSKFMSDMLRPHGVSSMVVPHPNYLLNQFQHGELPLLHKVLVMGWGYKTNPFILAAVAGAMPDTEFHLVSDNRKAFELAGVYPNVKIAPRVPPFEIERLYKDYSLMLNLSIKAESYGMVNAEALACGVSVIGGMTGALREFADCRGYITTNLYHIDDVVARIRHFQNSPDVATTQGHMDWRASVAKSAPGTDPERYVELLLG